MSELSYKTSMKKGFTAPIIKDNVFNKECSTDHDSKEPKKQKTKKQNKEINPENDQKPLQSDMKQAKTPVSLTDSQYEEIFDGVLKGGKTNSDNQQNTPIDEFSLVEQKLQTPLTGGSKEELVKHKSEPTTPAQKPKAIPQVSPWGSQFSKQASQASSILKEIETESLIGSSTCVPSPSSSSDSSTETSRELPVQTLPPQQSRKDQRKLLEELQHCRNVGVWVYCDRTSCQKVRYLPYITDPQDVPDVWYCHMNKDPKYNNCQYEEQPPSAEEEEDMIYNTFTAGSVVWAHVPGYPWWPAMVDDDPDLAEYYWLLEDTFTVTHYHVVFFDEGPVTRAWVDLKHISSYAKHDNKYKQTTCRGIDFTHRIRVAKEQANDALTLNSYQRLPVYSFIARYKGPISTSKQKMQNVMKKYKLKSKKREKTDQTSRIYMHIDIEPLATKNLKPNENPIKNKRKIKENSSAHTNSKKQKVDIDKCATSVKDKPAYKTKRKIVSKTSENLTEVDTEETYLTSQNNTTNFDIQQDSQDLDSSKHCESETPSIIVNSEPYCLPETSEHNIKYKIGGNAIQRESKTASYILGSIADKSDLFCQPELSQLDMEDTTDIGSVVEPSQMSGGASQENKHSQSTIADCFMAECEDEVPSSQQSLPFEE